MLGQHYQQKATITFSRNRMSISASDPRPLYQATTALAQQFGWVIDYEDPVYPESASIDIAVSSWKATHPGQKGLLVPAGGSFKAEIERIRGELAKDELSALRQLTGDYNLSRNPGTFEVLTEPDGRITVSGLSGVKSTVPYNPFQQTYHPESREGQPASEALNELVDKCGKSAGVPIQLGNYPVNAFREKLMTALPDRLSCREGLDRILTEMPYSLQYTALYDIGLHCYFLNIAPAIRLQIDASGKSRFVPVHDK